MALLRPLCTEYVCFGCFPWEDIEDIIERAWMIP